MPTKLPPAAGGLICWCNWYCLNCVIAIAVSLSTISATAADDSVAQRDQLRASYATQLRDLAAWCDSHDLKRQAELTRNWLPRRNPTMSYIFILPETLAAPEKLVDSPAARQWWDRFTELRRTEAKDLFELAALAAKENRPALAFELVRETVREDPNHQRGRAILGQQLYDGRWVSAETARRLAAGQVWNEKFGWLPADQVSQYDQGMRYYRGHWIAYAEDDRLHSNIYNGWHIESDHYTVITNHSLAEGARLAMQLELLNDVWRQVFFGYYATPGQLERWLADPPDAAAQPSRKTHQVAFFRDQSQYVAALQAAEPQIAKTLGYYSNSAKTAYFFAGDQQYAGTLFHEATHQLFREVRSGAIDPGRKNNFLDRRGCSMLHGIARGTSIARRRILWRVLDRRRRERRPCASGSQAVIRRQFLRTAARTLDRRHARVATRRPTADDLQPNFRPGAVSQCTPIMAATVRR